MDAVQSAKTEGASDGGAKKNIEMSTSLVNCVIQILWNIRKCLKGFMERCASEGVWGGKQESHIGAKCLGVPLVAHESFISVPKYKSSCWPLPAAFVSLAS